MKEMKEVLSCFNSKQQQINMIRSETKYTTDNQK